MLRVVKLSAAMLSVVAPVLRVRLGAFPSGAADGTQPYRFAPSLKLKY
jgi:hypothetical protein